MYIFEDVAPCHVTYTQFNVIYRFEIYLFLNKIHPTSKPFDVDLKLIKINAKNIPIHALIDQKYRNWLYMKLISFRSFIRNCKLVRLMIAIFFFFYYGNGIVCSQCHVTLKRLRPSGILFISSESLTDSETRE